jgi:hypothetical protein
LGVAGNEKGNLISTELTAMAFVTDDVYRSHDFWKFKPKQVLQKTGVMMTWLQKGVKRFHDLPARGLYIEKTHRRDAKSAEGGVRNSASSASLR